MLRDLNVYRSIAIAVLLIGSLPGLSVARDSCRLRTFSEVACSTSDGLRTSISATNADQLRSVGCVRLTDKPKVDVIEKIGDQARVTITTPSAIIPLWIRSYSLDCSPAPANSRGTQFPSTYQQTGDGFVWKEGKRIGWVDADSSTFYRIDQITIAGTDKPVIKPREVGSKISTNLDAAIVGSEQAMAAPLETALERTADGFVWRNGKRIGWIDAAAATYYKIDQLTLVRDLPPRPKDGVIGSSIAQGRLVDAVLEAEKRN